MPAYAASALESYLLTLARFEFEFEFELICSRATSLRNKLFDSK